MKLSSGEGIGFRERQVFRLFLLRKKLHQFLRFRPGCDKTVLLIAGCQRSGTSMFHHLFRLDPASITYEEESPLSVGDTRDHLRWVNPDLVRDRITADRAPLVVAKCLVESQNLSCWLDMFPRSRSIWMIRHYADVAASSVKYFGPHNSLRDLEPIVAGDRTDWRAQHMDHGDTEVIRRLHRPDMDPLDAAALFWYARNSLFFSRGLDGDVRVAVCRYEDIIARPAASMSRVYAFLHRPYPGDRIVRDVVPGSVGRGREIPLSPEVRELCDAMWERLLASRSCLRGTLLAEYE